MNVNVSNFCVKIFCQSFVLLLISCCNFNVIDYSETGLNSYDLNFDSDIPIKLQSHLIFSLGVNKNIKEKGFVLFTHRIDLWEKQDFLSILKKHQKSLKINKISRPVNYLPLNNDFKNIIKIKIVLLQKY